MSKIEYLFDDYPETENLVEFIQWAKNLLLQVPMPYIPSAFIDITPEGSHGDYFSHVRVGYYRPFTKDETEHFEKISLAEKAAEIKRAKATLAKYGVTE